MKKFALILLTCVYALAVVGAAASNFYCCEQAAYTNNSIACCTEQYQERTEVQAYHIATTPFHLPSREAHAPHIVSSVVMANTAQESLTIINKSIPGGCVQPSVPFYILYCVYRI